MIQNFCKWQKLYYCENHKHITNTKLNICLFVAFTVTLFVRDTYSLFMERLQNLSNVGSQMDDQLQNENLVRLVESQIYIAASIPSIVQYNRDMSKK